MKMVETMRRPRSRGATIRNRWDLPGQHTAKGYRAFKRFRNSSTSGCIDVHGVQTQASSRIPNSLAINVHILALTLLVSRPADLSRERRVVRGGAWSSATSPRSSERWVGGMEASHSPRRSRLTVDRQTPLSSHSVLPRIFLLGSPAIFQDLRPHANKRPELSQSDQTTATNNP